MKKKSIAVLAAVAFVFIILLAVLLLMSGTNNPATYSDVKYGPDSRNTLDIYLPDSAENMTADVPAFLYIHGGGWSTGSKEDGKGYAEGLNSNGYAVISINYRYLSDDVDCYDILDDIDLVMKFIDENGADYHIRTDKIAVGGDSAGGHLAMLYAYSRESPVPVAFVMSGVGPADLSDPGFFENPYAAKGSDVFFWSVFNQLAGTNYTLEEMKSGNTPELLKVSPIYYIGEGSAPTVFGYGVKDELVPFSNAERMKAKVESLDGYEYEFWVFENSGHALNENGVDSEVAERYYLGVFEGLEKYLLDY
ncbi:alpha/beta hydrolase [Methanolapillus africanus]